MNKIMVDCNCYSDEHRAFFSLADEKDLIFMHIFLVDYDNIFKRIWKAVKYVFGYKCKFGHWDEFQLSRREAKELMEMLNELIDYDKQKVVSQ